jgi:hypothetical protein
MKQNRCDYFISNKFGIKIGSESGKAKMSFWQLLGELAHETSAASFERSERSKKKTYIHFKTEYMKKIHNISKQSL